MTAEGRGQPEKRRALLTVDLEDYRRHELARQFGGEYPPHPAEVGRQLDLLLETFDETNVKATFFTVGQLTGELAAASWKRIDMGHEIGCHGYRHTHVFRLGPNGFLEDLRRAKSSLEDTLGRRVISFRAPYFSSDGCDPWFGRALAETGFRLDSSRRMRRLSDHAGGTCTLPGSDDAVVEIPLLSVGVGPKRLTVIGGTYFRLLPLMLIRRLLVRAERRGFVPMVYLHPYDIDADTAPLELPAGQWKARAGDRIRRMGRSGVGAKLRSLAETYDFQPVESLLAD